jgi:hypothetical protein
VARPRPCHQPDGPLRRGKLERHSQAYRGYRGRRRGTQLRLPAWHEPNAAWDRPSARCPNTSRWWPAGASTYSRTCRCIVKLTPNVTSILRYPATRGARPAARTRCQLINTVNSVMGVDLDQISPDPHDRRPAGLARRLLRCGRQAHRTQHGGRDCARRPRRHGMPISGIGGVTTWRDAAEFIATGRGQRCRSARPPWSTASRSCRK